MTLPSKPLYPEANFSSEKVCTKCGGDPQPLGNFHRYASGRYGRTSRCKKCVAESTQELKRKRLAAAETIALPDFKVCSKDGCPYNGTPQPLDCFAKHILSKDGHQAWCKTCTRANGREDHKKNSGKINARHRRRYKENPEPVLLKAKQYQADHPKERKESAKKYYKNNKDRVLSVGKAWRTENPEKEKIRKKRRKRDHWEKQIIGTIRDRARRRGILFDMSPSDLLDPATGKLPEFCPLFPHIRLDYATGPNRRIWASVDRIIPELGYITGNVWVVSFGANVWKSNGSNPDERKRIFAIMNGRKKKKEPDAQQPSLFDDI